MLVMVAGRLAASGDHRTLRRLMTDRPHTVRIRASDPRMLASVLVTLPDVIGVEIHGTQVLVRTADHAVLARQLVRAAQVCNVTLHAVQPADESLRARLRLSGEPMNNTARRVSLGAPSWLGTMGVLSRLAWARTMSPGVIMALAAVLALPVILRSP